MKCPISRKYVMVLGGSCFFFGALIQCLAEDVAMLYIGRILLGFGIGFANQVCALHFDDYFTHHCRVHSCRKSPPCSSCFALCFAKFQDASSWLVSFILQIALKSVMMRLMRWAAWLQSVPLYISEMAPPAHRGQFNILFQLCTTVGIFGASLINYGAFRTQVSGTIALQAALQLSCH